MIRIVIIVINFVLFFSAVVDKRGRNVNQVEKEDLKKFYDIEGDSDNGELD